MHDWTLSQIVLSPSTVPLSYWTLPKTLSGRSCDWDVRSAIYVNLVRRVKEE